MLKFVYDIDSWSLGAIWSNFRATSLLNKTKGLLQHVTGYSLLCPDSRRNAKTDCPTV